MPTTGTVMPAPKYTCYDSNGLPLAGGLLEVYEAGTSTPATTYSDGELAVPNPWPVQLDLAGRATVFLAPGFYKFIQRTSLATGGTLVWSQDNISSVAPFNTDLDLAGVAGEHIYEGAVAYLSVGAGGGTIAGRWYLANAGLAYASSGAHVVAIAPNAIPAGSIGAFRLQGRTEIPGATFVVGASYYISTVPGGLVTPAPVSPNFERQIGIADSTTTLVSATGFASNPFFPGSITVGGTLTVSGQTALGGNLLMTNGTGIHCNTTVGVDNGVAQISGGGPPISAARGAAVVLSGANHATSPGTLQLFAGQPAGKIEFRTGAASAVTGTIHPSGGLSLGSAADPAAGGLYLAGSIQMLGSIGFGGGFHEIRLGTADGADLGSLTLSGGGAVGPTRGAYVALYGADVAGNPGQMHFVTGDNASSVMYFGPGGTLKHAMYPTGGLSLGSTAADPGLGNLYLAGATIMFAGQGIIRPNTGAGADSALMQIYGGGGGTAPARGACINVWGVNAAAQGSLDLFAATTTGQITFHPGGTERGRWHPSGGLSLFGTSDPTAGHVNLGSVVAGSPFIRMNSVAGTVDIGGVATALGSRMSFYNANGQVGTINTSGSTTAYNTTSDVRLKTDRGVMTETTVLPRLQIHQFIWKSDYSRAYGLYAQEAINVVPFAISEGTDETDDQGRPARPWGVDYSKLVPDLILGWQQHERIVADLLTRIATLEATHAAPGVLETKGGVPGRAKRSTGSRTTRPTK